VDDGRNAEPVNVSSSEAAPAGIEVGETEPNTGTGLLVGTAEAGIAVEPPPPPHETKTAIITETNAIETAQPQFLNNVCLSARMTELAGPDDGVRRFTAGGARFQRKRQQSTAKACNFKRCSSFGRKLEQPQCVTSKASG
jgi:hypothetical protein